VGGKDQVGKVRVYANIQNQTYQNRR
jgi:hypothetical protein